MTVVYKAPPVPGDLMIQKDSSGFHNVIQTDTGIIEQVYNTQTAADKYVATRTSGGSLKSSDAAAKAIDTGEPTASNTTASNTTSANTPVLNPITKEVTSQQPNSNTTAPNTNPNGDPNPNAVITPPTADQPSNQKVANVSIDPSNPEYTGPGIGEGELTAPSNPIYDNDPRPQPAPSLTPPPDWRVRLSLAPAATYLYKDKEMTEDDILFPLKSTNGVIFPYLPTINQTYKANYNSADIIHTNYRNWFYSHSSIDDITIVADFTAQDNTEARYMLAVIHFFKSVTKMFYGQDSNPRGGTPPPLCYLSGLGAYQFNNHPILVSSFTYNLSNDVDYIRTDTSEWFDGGGITNLAKKGKPKGNIFTKFLSDHRLAGANLNKNATPPRPNFSSITTKGANITYVPTKIQIQISGYPVVTRKDISENFKLAGKGGYGTGELTKNNGIW